MTDQTGTGYDSPLEQAGRDPKQAAQQGGASGRCRGPARRPSRASRHPPAAAIRA